MPPSVDRRALACCAAALWLLLTTPTARAWFEQTMVRHMLLHLPLLALIGACWGTWWRHVLTGPPARALQVVQRFNAGGATGILFASFVAMLWMLPRCLDLARLDPVADTLKFITLPGAGCAVALSWSRLPAIARAVVHIEVIASFWRFGWGYLAAETRLCLAYLAEDQQRTGELLLLAGAAYAVISVWRPLFGRSPSATQTSASS